ncbi:MAG TPA: hypothetical protein VH302_08210 [Bryobacteraceae bacterium]|nr:hypothetical protein [Bryobacteraceae bacterium]
MCRLLGNGATIRDSVNSVTGAITRFCLLAILVTSLSGSQQVALYSLDSDNIWNRIHRVLHVRESADGRECGGDEIDPLLWPETQHLLMGKSHAGALP